VSLQSKKQYLPSDLNIVRSYRFDGMTNPADETELLAVKANDGSKETIILSHSTLHNHDEEVINKIPHSK
jgi:hypothetical protein